MKRPIKHFYQTIPGHFTWPDFTAYVADRLASAARRPGLLNATPRLAEVGILNGQSIACMAVELQRRGLFASIQAIDTHLSDEFRKNIEPVAARVQATQGISWEVAKGFLDGIFDYVMIDADHDYDAVRKDIAAWLPKVRPGGILAGHDYTPEIPGVVRAVTEAFERVNVWRGSRFCGPKGDQPPGNYYPVWWIEAP